MTDTEPGSAPLHSGFMPYTQDTHDALVAAQAVARPPAPGSGRPSDRHAAVNAAHLMLGILAETGSTATRALIDQSVALGTARMRVAGLTLPAAPGHTAGARRLPPLDGVLDAARASAAQHGHPAVGTGHLLLALCTPDCIADVLEDLGLDRAAAERFVLRRYESTAPVPRNTGEEFI